MATLDLRQSVMEYVKNADNRFLRLVKAMAENYNDDEGVIAYSVDGKPLTLKQYNQELLDAEDEIKKGRITSVENLEKEAENW